MICGLVLAVAFAPAARAGSDAAEFFMQACAPCHGADAKGDGPRASGLAMSPPDLTAISRRAGGEFPEAEVYATIEGLTMPEAHGTREMPVWGEVILSQELGSSTSTFDAKQAEIHTRERLRALVDYLVSIQE